MVTYYANYLLIILQLKFKALRNLLYDFTSDIGLMVCGLLDPNAKVSWLMLNSNDVVLEGQVKHDINNIGLDEAIIPPMFFMTFQQVGVDVDVFVSDILRVH